MKKFEYKTIELDASDNNGISKSLQLDSKEIQNTLNRLGEDGWELVNAIDNVMNGFTLKIILFFKREK